jgi:hypothetical protein
MSKIRYDKYSAEEWDHFRERFDSSMLNDMEIAVLGQNAGYSWPFKGKGETPAKYIAYDLEELKSVPGLVGKPSRIRTLMDILRETLAFDDPFADLADSVEFEGEADSTFDRILIKLDIPGDFPAHLMHFHPNTKALLDSEGAHTLIDSIHYAQKMPTDSPVGQDLKNFLNGLAHKDEFGISKHLPYRRGVRGLHLAEAFGLIVDELPESAQLQLLVQTEPGIILTQAEEALLNNADQANMETSIAAAVEQAAKVCQWFTKDARELEEVFNSESSPARYFIMINDPPRERRALALAKLHFGVDDRKKSGFIGKLFGR